VTISLVNSSAMSVLELSSDEPTIEPPLPNSAWPDWSVASNAPPSMRLRKLVPLKVATEIYPRSILRPLE
jgi:hypothetical protein